MKGFRMARIDRVEIQMVDLLPKVKRTDAIQSFVSQETPIVTIVDSDGAKGTGYSYTIGTGGSSVMRLLRDHLIPRLIGRDGERIEAIWHDLEFATHATTIGAISALAIAAIDTALWDLRANRQQLPLWIVAGGAKDRCPLYTTEGGWLHIEAAALVEDALRAKGQGFRGSKIKIGRPHGAEDHARLAAVRAAVGDTFELMTDANQGFSLDEAIRRAERLRDIDLAWVEEPLPADDIDGHIRLSQATAIPVAVGESLYSIRHFREYMQRGACSIVQVDVARIGGITPWLKVAHAAEAFDIPVCPHFLMELHVSLVCAVQNGKYVEYIPQLDALTTSGIRIENGMALAPHEPGIGIAWDWQRLHQQSVSEFSQTFGKK
jgi:L-alanine-DL-glutamate epimerase-like enolase superfamily enzyme